MTGRKTSAVMAGKFGLFDRIFRMLLPANHRFWDLLHSFGLRLRAPVVRFSQFWLNLKMLIDYRHLCGVSSHVSRYRSGLLAPARLKYPADCVDKIQG
jgi:hypothetical protein